MIWRLLVVVLIGGSVGSLRLRIFGLILFRLIKDLVVFRIGESDLDVFLDLVRIGWIFLGFGLRIFR